MINRTDGPKPAPLTSSAAHSSRPPSSPTSRRKQSSPTSSRHSSPRATKDSISKRGQNGSSSVAQSNGKNNDDSEAETEILSGDEPTKVKLKKRLLKSEDEHSTPREDSPATGKSDQPGSHPPSRRSSIQADAPDKKVKNPKRDHTNGEGKPKNVTKIREENKKALPRALSADRSLPRASPAPSDSAATGRSSPDRLRNAKSAEPRKRKLSDDLSKSRFEPPKQKQRLDSTARPSKPRHASPTSPVAQPTLGHRRSASTQSGIATKVQRKKRDVSTNSNHSDGRSKWADDSSDDSSYSHKGPPVPNLAPPKSGRMASRPLTSPARPGQIHGRRADKYGTTPLARACERGNFEQVKKMYDQAPEELNQEDNGGFTPLQKASLSGHTRVVKFLLDKNCRIDCCSKEERDTPLIDAVENSHFEVVKLLLEHGVNPHHSNKNGDRAIDKVDADDEHGPAIEEALKKAMAEYQVPDEDQEVTSQESPANSRRVRKGDRPDLLYHTLNRDSLLKFCQKGDGEAVGMCLASRVEPDYACVCAAARAGHSDILSLLLASAPRLERDPDPKAHDTTPLLEVIGRGHIKVLTLLLEQDNFNATRRTKDGKTYYEVAQERHGPWFQQEVDILKDHFEKYKEKRLAKKKQLADVKAGKTIQKDLPTPKSPKVSKTKKIDRLEPESKTKRLSSSSKDASKETVRRKRPVVEDDTSQDEAQTDDSHPPKPKQRKRASSTTVKASQSVKVKDDASSPANARIEEMKPKVKKPKQHKLVRREEPEDSDIEMKDDPAPVKSITKDRSRSKTDTGAGADDSVSTDTEQRNKKAEAEALAEKERLAQEEAIAKEQAEQLRQLEEQTRKQQERQAWLDTLPPAISSAIVDQDTRPIEDQKGVHGRRGIVRQFAYIRTNFLKDISPETVEPGLQEEQWTLSFYLIGLIGTSDFELEFWPHSKRPATAEQISDFFNNKFDVTDIAYNYHRRPAGWSEFSTSAHDKLIAQTRQQCKDMRPLYWLRASDLSSEIKKHDRLSAVELTFKKPFKPQFDPRFDAITARIDRDHAERKLLASRPSSVMASPSTVASVNGIRNTREMEEPTAAGAEEYPLTNGVNNSSTSPHINGNGHHFNSNGTGQTSPLLNAVSIPTPLNAASLAQAQDGHQVPSAG